jgi:hypothetical protein
MHEDLKQAVLRVAAKDPELRQVLIGVAKQAFMDLEDTEEIPVAPAVQRRIQSTQLRELGRALMVAAMRAPRQQMIQVGLLVIVLLNEMEKIAGNDPGLRGLKRRLVLEIRRQVLSQV